MLFHALPNVLYLYILRHKTMNKPYTTNTLEHNIPFKQGTIIETCGNFTGECQGKNKTGRLKKKKKNIDCWPSTRSSIPAGDGKFLLTSNSPFFPLLDPLCSIKTTRFRTELCWILLSFVSFGHRHDRKRSFMPRTGSWAVFWKFFELWVGGEET